MDGHRMSTEKKRSRQRDGTATGHRTPQAMRLETISLKLTNNENKTEAHRTMQFLDKYIL